MARPVDTKAKLEVGSVYPTKYYGDVEILEDLGSRAVTVKFLKTGYIRHDVKRYNVKHGKLKDPSVKSKSNDINIKEGDNCKNSYLKLVSDFPTVLYKCTLCGDKVNLVKKYSESNIPKSCGCISKLKPRVKDLTGEVINGVLVYGYISEGLWRVQYSCGHYGDLTTSAVKSDRMTSLCKSCVRRIPTTLEHGHARRSGYSSEYISWLGMKRRCEDDSHNRYEFYKGKGITYPEEWKNFKVFLSDMGYKPDPSYSIERLDIELPYSKENCVWASGKTQANNKSSNILIVKMGEQKPMSLKHWCELEGIDYKNAHYRFKYKEVPVEEILGDNYSLINQK